MTVQGKSKLNSPIANNTFKNVSHKLFILRKIRYMINVKAALDITKTMLCSVIDYCNIFLSSCTQGDLSDKSMRSLTLKRLLILLIMKFLLKNYLIMVLAKTQFSGLKAILIIDLKSVLSMELHLLNWLLIVESHRALF